LREPFEARHISKLPKQAGWMKDKKNEYKDCSVCGGYHHPKAVHLDYVGHAALTDRLLDCDPTWSWEPMALLDNGAPAIDGNGGMWIRLTVCDQTRIGYGHADKKTGGDAIKETIGDALRNAAMRFGAALDLWHKGDLHVDDEPEKPKKKKAKDMSGPLNSGQLTKATQDIRANFAAATDADELMLYAESKEAMAVREQLLRDDPDIVNGVQSGDGQQIGLDELYLNKLKELQQAARERTSPNEDDHDDAGNRD